MGSKYEVDLTIRKIEDQKVGDPIHSKEKPEMKVTEENRYFNLNLKEAIKYLLDKLFI